MMGRRWGLAAAVVCGLSGCTEGVEDLLGIDVYFVKLEAEPAKVAAVATSLADDFGVDIIHTYDSASEGFSAKLPRLLIPEIEGLDEVAYVAEDERAPRLPPDEKTPKVIELLDGDEVPFSIQRVGGAYGGSLSGIEVAVIDSGIDGDHPDLNVVASEDLVAMSGGTPARNGDLNGHGTHCAGTIGARENGEGVMGVAPGVALHGVRVLDENGSGYWTDIVAGLEYVLDHPEIRVVNMSLGGPAFPAGTEDPMEEAIRRLEEAGVVVVIAAGNETQDTANVAPAGYDLGLVVSAYDYVGGSDNGFAWFSNYGDAVDIAAPGVDIPSTYPGGTYAELSGTSMATPLVVGAVAAYFAEHPRATGDEAMAAVVATGEDGYAGQKGRHLEPLIDIEALLR